MSITILLVRHGQTDSNVERRNMGWSDEDLNEVGYAQVRRLSSRLASVPITAIYTSPLQRTRTTATILAGPHHLEPVVMDNLAEIRLGDWQGLHAEEVGQRWPELWQEWRTDPTEVKIPNGESFRQVAERAVEALETVIANVRGSQIVIVSHDIVVKALVTHVLGVSSNIYRRFVIDNASLSMVRFTNGMPHLIALNDTSHLEISSRSS